MNTIETTLYMKNQSHKMLVNDNTYMKNYTITSPKEDSNHKSRSCIMKHPQM